MTYDKLYHKKYREKNKAKMKEYMKRYRKEHKDKWKYSQKQLSTKQKYRKTGIGKKGYTLYNWKKTGLIDDDIHTLYYAYLKSTHCMICNIMYSPGQMTRRCIDHDHETGEVRYFCCGRCNCSILQQTFKYYNT